MSLESATYISQLNAANPTAGDPKSQGDDHLRLLKGVLQAQFPSLGAAAVTASAAELNNVVGTTGPLQAQVNAKAPLASPALTGTPTAPTAAALTGGTQLGTCGYADAAVAAEAVLRAAADALKAAKAGDIYAGTHDFSGATAIKAPTLPLGTNTTDVATMAALKAQALTTAMPVTGSDAGKVLTNDGVSAFWGYAMAPGTITLWPVDASLPSRALELDGSSLLRVGTYANLFGVLGTLYGAADGAHFNLPDFRGRFMRAWAHGSGNDPDRASRTAVATAGATMAAGDHVGTQQADAFRSHTHSQNATPVGGIFGNGSLGDGSSPQTGATGGNETRPINVNVMAIIWF